jgi:hypothetical protein
MNSTAMLDPRSPTIAPPMRTALIASFLWINASEVFRYFVFVLPMTRRAMTDVVDAAPMNLPVFLVWGAWDGLLFACASLLMWLYFERFGGGGRGVLGAGTLAWAAVFVLFWVATWNMNMTQAAIPLTALPMAWLETMVAAAILERGWRRSAPAAA